MSNEKTVLPITERQFKAAMRGRGWVQAARTAAEVLRESGVEFADPWIAPVAGEILTGDTRLNDRMVIRQVSDYSQRGTYTYVRETCEWVYVFADGDTASFPTTRFIEEEHEILSEGYPNE